MPIGVGTPRRFTQSFVSHLLMQAPSLANAIAVAKRLAGLLREVGSRLGLTRERVRQLEKQALHDLAWV